MDVSSNRGAVIIVISLLVMLISIAFIPTMSHVGIPMWGIGLVVGGSFISSVLVFTVLEVRER